MVLMMTADLAIIELERVLAVGSYYAEIAPREEAP